MFKVFKEEIELEGKKIILETGKIAKTSRWSYNCNLWRDGCYFNCSRCKKS